MLQVICAIVEHNNKVLICEQSASMKLPLKGEFLRGKIEKSESKATCLGRRF